MKKIIPVLIFISLFGESLFSQKIVIETASSGGGFISNEDLGLLYSIGQPFVNAHVNQDLEIQEGILHGLLRSYTVGIKEELISIDLHVFPNPSKDYFKIKNDFQNHGNLTIYNSSGHQILNKKLLPQEVVDVSHLPKGSYFVALITETSSGICSLVKI